MLVSRLPPHSSRPLRSRGLSQPAFLALLLVVAVAAGLGGFGFYHLGQNPDAVAATAPENGPGDSVMGLTRPDFSLPDLDGEVRQIGEWDGDVVLVNFWATWCPPCRKEMPAFVEVQEEFGSQDVTIVAVAIDEAEAVRDFANTSGINFPVLIGETDAMAVARDYGNRFGALPYSVLMDRQGKIRFIQAGELHKETFVRELKPLL
ncbi:MAG TPA: TlpA disulfide reductase family protein [Thioalkalivibrio sp.]|nr:TlpA disulfide reductase family protein [Thioalkalivibrio sp.]